MEITIPSIISLITLIMGFIEKKFNILKGDYIPIQNFLIGIISGIVIFFIGLETNLLKAIIICLISSLSAGGVYDVLKINVNNNNLK